MVGGCYNVDTSANLGETVSPRTRLPRFVVVTMASSQALQVPQHPTMLVGDVVLTLAATGQSASGLLSFLKDYTKK